MRSDLLVLALTGALMLSGCGSDGGAAGPALLRAENVARLQPSSAAPVAEVVRGLREFGHDLSKSEAKPGENWVSSPLSIAYAFAMARAGANGATAAQIDKAFRFPAVGVHEAFNAITHDVVTAERPPRRTDGEMRKPGAPARPPVMCINNALFPQSGFAAEQPFLRTLAEQYGAGVYPVDFRQQSAKEQIDAWAREQTADRIKKVFDQIDPDTLMVIANAVYLKADWAVPFEEDATGDAAFHRADGSTVQTPMMHLETGARHAVGPGWRAVELPYGGELVMWILLPSIELSPADLLTSSTLSAVASSLESTRVAVSLPRWDFAAEIDLKAALLQLGVRDAFDPDRADFSGMSKAVQLFVMQAVHRANITVDEYGTEAAAVTAIVMGPTSAPPPGIEFNVDHPFSFAVVHKPTGTPVFIGQVMDPNSH